MTNGEILAKYKNLRANTVVGLMFFLALVAFAVAGSRIEETATASVQTPAHSIPFQELHGLAHLDNLAIDPRVTKVPGTDYDILLDGRERQANPPLLTAIATWLSTQFDLPIIQSHPRVEIVPSEKIVALRYRGLENGRSAISSDSDTIAIYFDSAQTIYLKQGWTGSTAAELSVLVHEMVHHLQHLGGLNYECPQEREKLAYTAQDRWLGLFGHSLAQDFDLDGLSLLVKTRCFF